MKKEKLLPVAGCLLLFAAAVIAYPVGYHPESILHDTGFESLAVACSLAEHGTFADPYFPLKTGATALIPPAYPAFLSLLIRQFGEGPRGAFALQWCATVFMALQIALFPWAARRLGMGYTAGFVAGCLWLLAGIPKFDLWDATPYGLLALLLAALSLPSGSGEPTQGRMALTGALWGVSLLSNPAGVVVLAALVAWLYFSGRVAGRKLLTLALVPLAVVAPWVARNYAALHHLVFIRDNLGLQLAISNNDCASYSFELDRYTRCFAPRHPNESLPEAKRVVALGEVDYDRARLREAVDWSAAHPRRFVRLTWERFEAFWLPWTVRYPWERPEDLPRRRLLVSVLTLLSIPGLILLWKRERRSAVICLLWLAFFPPVYYVTGYQERFRNPILWATFLPASYFLVATAQRVLQKGEVAAAAQPAA
jgi:hypothetical protein